MAQPLQVVTLPQKDLFGNDGFPLAIRRMLRQNATPVHNHRFSELVLILSGQGTHVTEEGNYPIAGGDVFVVHPMAPHGFRNIHSLSLVNVLYDWGALDLNRYDVTALAGYHTLFMVEPQFRARRQLRAPLRLRPGDLTYVAGIMDALEQELVDQSDGYRFMAVSRFMHLVAWLSRHYAESPPESAGQLLRIGGVLSYIERHFAKSITVAQLCSVAHMSRSSLHHHFFVTTGYSPLDYLLRLRIAKSAELLQSSDKSILDIALAVGFKDNSYFSRQFKRILGHTPRDFRASARILGYDGVGSRRQSSVVVPG